MTESFLNQSDSSSLSDSIGKQSIGKQSIGSSSHGSSRDSNQSLSPRQDLAKLLATRWLTRLLLLDKSAVEQVEWLAGKLAIATLILMAIGSATRVMNAGLACPDWPLCYGTLLPTQQMDVQVFLEWFHRLDASFVGFGTIVLLGLCVGKRKQLPIWAPWMALLSLSLVVLQGALGALTVTELLRFDIVTAHLGTALLFFGILLTFHLLLSPYQPVGSVGRLRWVGLTSVFLVYLQSLLGGVVASRWALHQCLGGGELCLVMNSHIAGVIPATLATLSLVILAWRSPALSTALRRLATAAAIALVAQASLGALALKLRLQIEPLTVTHQLVGATLLGILIAFTVLAWRDATVSGPASTITSSTAT